MADYSAPHFHSRTSAVFFLQLHAVSTLLYIAAGVMYALAGLNPVPAIVGALTGLAFYGAVAAVFSGNQAKATRRFYESKLTVLGLSLFWDRDVWTDAIERAGLDPSWMPLRRISIYIWAAITLLAIVVATIIRFAIEPPTIDPFFLVAGPWLLSFLLLGWIAWEQQRRWILHLMDRGLLQPRWWFATSLIGWTYSPFVFKPDEDAVTESLRRRAAIGQVATWIWALGGSLLIFLTRSALIGG